MLLTYHRLGGLGVAQLAIIAKTNQMPISVFFLKQDGGSVGEHNQSPIGQPVCDEPDTFEFVFRA